MLSLEQQGVVQEPEPWCGPESELESGLELELELEVRPPMASS